MPGPSSNISPSLSAGDIQTVAAASAAGLTSLTTKDDLDLLHQERIYEDGNKSTIGSLRKAVIVTMCVNRFKGKESEYTQLLKPALVTRFIAEVSHESPCVRLPLLIVHT